MPSRSATRRASPASSIVQQPRAPTRAASAADCATAPGARRRPRARRRACGRRRPPSRPRRSSRRRPASDRPQAAGRRAAGALDGRRQRGQERVDVGRRWRCGRGRAAARRAPRCLGHPHGQQHVAGLRHARLAGRAGASTRRRRRPAGRAGSRPRTRAPRRCALPGSRRGAVAGVQQPVDLRCRARGPRAIALDQAGRAAPPAATPRPRGGRRVSSSGDGEGRGCRARRGCRCAPGAPGRRRGPAARAVASRRASRAPMPGGPPILWPLSVSRSAPHSAKSHRQLADGLDGVGVERDAVLVRDGGELGHRLDRADLVVGPHHADHARRRRVVRDAPRAASSARTRPLAVGLEPGDLGALGRRQEVDESSTAWCSMPPRPAAGPRRGSASRRA